MDIGISPEALVGGLFTLAGGTGLWAYLGSRGKARTDLITIAQDAAVRVIERFEKIVADQDRRIEELEAQDERCRSELAEIKRRLG